MTRFAIVAAAAIHLDTADLLTPEQIRRYGELRGYAKAGTGGHRHSSD